MVCNKEMLQKQHLEILIWTKHMANEKNENNLFYRKIALNQQKQHI
jgi:hypothetical protein